MQLKLENLSKTYTTNDGQITAVNDVSLNIPSNKIFGIIGKSGAGKSSLVRLISLLETPDSGAVYFDNKRVDNLSKKALIEQRRGIGMIFQNFNLFSSRNAAKNIAYPMEICGMPKAQIKERVNEMLKLVGLEGRGDAPISTLSGGQKQRIAIARALSTKPAVLFCDEATSALDPQTTRAILQLIREIQQKMNLTVIMITHQMEVVRDACDEVAVIEEGKVVEQGLVSDIFTNPKSSVTKDFLAKITTNQNKENTDDNQSSFVRWSDKKGTYSLHFINEETGKPVISRICKKFNIEVNILAAGIQNLPSQKVGTMIVDFEGEKEEIQKAIDFCKEQGILIEKEGK